MRVALEISSVLLLISLCVFKIETSGPYLITAHEAMLCRPVSRSYSKYNASVISTTFYFIYNGIFVRATCFDLVGHPQAFQEERSKSCLVLLHCGIPNAYKVLGFHNAVKLNGSWICLLGGPEDDLLGRNMSP